MKWKLRGERHTSFMLLPSNACGAISGFHATQSPLMARCMTSEYHGRPIFRSYDYRGNRSIDLGYPATYFFHE